ncbi:hypothetical protein JR316_0005685 [Psilocybe cubensis]|uniref:Uncharacterized protein n=1 Tax=Psilocybe cubensis TaxID=181762 RepID=A0ACB8GZI1_PSICU|nr:hypothetical protein JR316_0005685 [Psilocybe cubensis]KAH9481165.1 hypothetical protein JR316_0005685 [Psilocybe cubensis]
MRLIWAFDLTPTDGSNASGTKWNLEDEYNDCKVNPRGKERVKVIEDLFNGLRLL